MISRGRGEVEETRKERGCRASSPPPKRTPVGDSDSTRPKQMRARVWCEGERRKDPAARRARVCLLACQQLRRKTWSPPSQPLLLLARPVLSVPPSRGRGHAARRDRAPGRRPTPPFDATFEGGGTGGMGCVQSATTPPVGQWRAVPCSRAGRWVVPEDDHLVEADVEAGRIYCVCFVRDESWRPLDVVLQLKSRDGAITRGPAR